MAADIIEVMEQGGEPKVRQNPSATPGGVKATHVVIGQATAGVARRVERAASISFVVIFNL